MSELKIKWTINALEALPQEFFIIPTTGKIKAKATYKINVFFKAIQEQVFDLKINFHVQKYFLYTNIIESKYIRLIFFNNTNNLILKFLTI